MREILFRGKRKDNGEWISGDLRQWSETSTGICDRDLKRTFPVRPETVGQYTGLTDRNGKKIFEGDILRQADTFNVVHWNHRAGSWRAEDIRPFMGEMISAFFHLAKVIGNRWDNPELLKDGAKDG